MGAAGLGWEGQGCSPSLSPIFRGTPGAKPLAASLALTEVRQRRRGATPEATLGWHMAGLGASILLGHFSCVRSSLRLNLHILLCKPGAKGSKRMGGACWEGSRQWSSQERLPMRKDSGYLRNVGK